MAQDCADAGNELGYMYYHNMDGSGNNTGNQTVDGVVLTGVQRYYWSGTEYDSGKAWHFFFFTGRQFKGVKGNPGRHGWAVRSGDVAAVPEPGTAVLMGAGLAGLLGFGRCKRRR
ncbi:MAG: PEP-CTERM sorting domain-containing protein [Sulfitobacter sp.]|nr:PEP-CTERM sorting domain-containing protein [Sulfitobacter sp.]